MSLISKEILADLDNKLFRAWAVIDKLPLSQIRKREEQEAIYNEFSKIWNACVK